ncbi:MAG: YbaK/prolyl-tRNA synthetase associated region [Marmoricola sp.]|nr:YbaK/prolyl-tRNA synthetase associated region [Marmoricola sp.]
MSSATHTLGQLTTVPVLDRLDLVAAAVATLLRGWEFAAEVGVVPIDASHSETAATVDVYGVPLDAGANCVVIAGKREGVERIAACVVRGDTRADVNNRVKRLLDVRKCSFLDHDRAVTETGMEHGGITPIGVPEGWRLLVDSRVVETDLVLIGSGIRGSKLILPGRVLGELPGAEVVTDLAH